MDDDDLRKFFPTDFGRQEKVLSKQETKQAFQLTAVAKESLPVVDSDSDSEYGPAPPQKDDDESSDVSSDSDKDTLVDQSDNLPTTHKIMLKEHTKTVSGIAVDAAGARIVTGGRDHQMKLWDFNGMDTSFRSFKTIEEPCDGNPIRDIQFNSTGDRFIVAPASAQARLYDREGEKVGVFLKGDPYIRDIRHTKGHTAPLTCIKWHPTDKRLFASCAYDSTVRVWDPQVLGMNSCVIFAKSKMPGGRTPMLCCSFTADGNKIIAGGQDGAIRLWGINGPYSYPSVQIDNAHTMGQGISGIACAYNNINFVTRGLDDTVKTWDIRNTKSALCSRSNLPNLFEETNIVYSPDEKVVCTGISSRKNQADSGKLVLLKADNLEVVDEVDLIPNGSVCRVVWHSRINQILAGCTDGSVHCCYDPYTSVRGAKLCVVKAPKGKTIEDIAWSHGPAANAIINPYALPLYQEDNPNDIITLALNRKPGRILKDPVLTRRPDLPPKDHLKTESWAVKQLKRTITKDTTREQDPREALLKHAEAAANDPYWIAPAYKKSQPAPVLADKVYENEFEAKKELMKKRRK